MRIVSVITLCLISVAAFADPNCSRSELQIAVNGYLAAQTAGDRDLLSAAPQTKYYEQQESIDAADSIVN